MSPLVQERLAGCTADSLDSYLRGLGFFLLAGEIEPEVRSWWDEDGVLWLATPTPVEALADELVAAVLDPNRGLPRTIRTPWRGKAGAGLRFVELRNEAEDAELAWVDACGLPRGAASGSGERSERENNPLLGQGGGFGRAEVADAHAAALARLRKLRAKRSPLLGALLAVVRGHGVGEQIARQVSVTNAVLSAYQSGRATGPGLTANDVKPASQKLRVSAWDVLLVLEGLRAFRGSPTRRPEPGAVEQASFPLLVRARPVALGRADDLRDDGDRTFELLAPQWSVPCTARTFRHVLAAARLRTPRGVARDTLDAALVQAQRAVHGLGFDRLVRFAFVAPSDPRYRYAVRRKTLEARGSAAARQALQEILPFVRRLDAEVGGDAPRRALGLARRRLEDVLAGLATGAPLATLEERRREARRVQDALVALALLEAPAAWAAAHVGAHGHEGLEAPRLSHAWLQLADDGSPEYRLARALAGSYVAERVSVLREHLLPQRRDDGRFLLDPHSATVDLQRVTDPLGTLVDEVLHALRVSDRLATAEVGSSRVRPSDVALVLSGALGPDGERRLALLVAALSGIDWPALRSAGRMDAADRSVLGAEVARLLLAASSADDAEPTDAVAERAGSLASLARAGNIAAARVAADRELRRRELDLLPPPPLGAAPPAAPARLAFALLVPLDPAARGSLVPAVTRSPVTVQQGGPP